MSKHQELMDALNPAEKAARLEKENSELIHDIEEYVQIVSELTDDNMRLRKALCDYEDKKLSELADNREKTTKKWIDHKDSWNEDNENSTNNR